MRGKHMKKCINCQKDILSKTVCCPYCGAVQVGMQEFCHISEQEEKDEHEIRDTFPSNISDEANGMMVTDDDGRMNSLEDSIEVSDKSVESSEKQSTDFIERIQAEEIDNKELHSIETQELNAKEKEQKKELEKEDIFSIHAESENYCYSCGNKIGKNHKFCSVCGTEIKSHVKKSDECKEYKRFCYVCGNKLEKRYKFCPICGSEIESSAEQFQDNKQNKNLNTEKIRDDFSEHISNAKKSVDSLMDSVEVPKAALNFINVFVGVLYIYWMLGYFPYLNYYLFSDKIWGFGMIIAYGWSAFILFIIGIKCQKKYGRQLIYALFGGIALSVILKLIQILRISRYYQSGFSEYAPIIGYILVAFINWTLMKKYNLLMPAEECGTITDVIKDIPYTLQEILLKKSHEERKMKNTIERPAPEKMNDSQIRIWNVMSSNLFLVFVLLFTVNLLYHLFSGFSLIKLLSNTLTILICIGLWRILIDARNATLSRGGFSMINVVITLEFVFYMCLDVLVLIVVIALNLGATINIITFMVLFIHLFYWIALRKTTSSSKQIVSGASEPIYTSVYIMFVLGLNAFTKVCIFIWLNIVQSTINSVTGSINEYGNGTSSLIASMLSEYGLNYSYGYEASSSLVDSITTPIISWIQSTFGVGLDVPGMLLAIAIPICEIMILSRLRSYKNNV